MQRFLVVLVAVASAWLAPGIATAHADPVPKAAISADRCGPTMPKPEGGTWECTFADEFNGRKLDRQMWMPRTQGASGTKDGRACYVDDPSNVSVRRGDLLLTVRRASQPVACAGGSTNYTAGSVSTYRTFSQQYGRFEARYKSTEASVPGLQEAFWLWPDDRTASTMRWPTPGEIDVAETYSRFPNLVIPFLHQGFSLFPRPGVNTAWDCPAERGEYNTYVLTWTPQKLTIDVNGRTCLVNTSGHRAFKKPYIMALTSMLGVGRNAATSETPIPAQMSVDHVKVWK